MKKIAILAFAFFTCFTNAQKKKSSKAPAPTATVITTSGNASVELFKNNLFLLVKNGVQKDTMLLKTYTDKTLPTECKVTNFTTKGTSMYYVTWNEKVVTETKLKKEETAIVESQIWNPAKKELQIGNTQSTSNIKEIVFLDRLKTASETQQRVKKSGYEFIFNNGDFILRTKSGDTKYTYNTTTSKYEVDKGTPAATTTPKKKRR